MERLPARTAAALRRMPPRAVLAVAAAFWAVALGLTVLGQHGGDPRALLSLGELRDHPQALAGVPRSSEHGYDGQYYAALATDPLLRRPETVACLDAPSYRAGRIGAPIAAWLLAFGRPQLAVVLYQLLCWAGCLAAVYLAARWLAAERLPAAWALLLAVSAGLATSMYRSTPDGLAVALILAALWQHRQRRPLASVAALTAASLVRETSLLAAAAIALVELRQRRPQAAAASLALPLAAVASWRLALGLLLDEVRGGGVFANFGLPFAWLPIKISRLTEVGLRDGLMELAGCLALASGLVVLALAVLRIRRWSAVEASYAAFAVLGLVLAGPVYSEVYAHARVLLALPFLAVLMIGPADRTGTRAVLLAYPFLLAVTGGFVVRAELRPEVIRTALAAIAAGKLGPAPAPRVSYVLPLLRAPGPFGAQWRSELELENLSEEPVELTIELLSAGSDDAPPPRAHITLGPLELRRVDDALGELFGRDGAGALRVREENGRASIRARTHDRSGRIPSGPTLSAVGAPLALGGGAHAVLPGLAAVAAGRSRTRTSLGIANLSPVRIEIELAIVDERGAVLGAKRLWLKRRELRQINDLFAALRIPPPAAGSARISSPTPRAAILAYAMVVDRDPPGVVHVLAVPAAEGGP